MISFSVIGTGFPPLTRYWTLYYYEPGAPGRWVGDGLWHGVNDVIYFTDVAPGTPTSFLACFCYSWAGETSEQFNSDRFETIDGARYEYDIASGKVTLLEAKEITGHLTKVEVPRVAAGRDIRATIGYYALNPGAAYWKTFLIAVGNAERIKKELAATREIGEEGHGEHTYTVGVMPDYEISITFALFAHPDAGYDWSWGDWEAWLNGWPNPAGAQCLDYAIVWLSPAPPEAPEEGQFRSFEISYKRA